MLFSILQRQQERALEMRSKTVKYNILIKIANKQLVRILKFYIQTFKKKILVIILIKYLTSDTSVENIDFAMINVISKI